MGDARRPSSDVFEPPLRLADASAEPIEKLSLGLLGKAAVKKAPNVERRRQAD
jgi:hypothetical protein